MAIATITTTTEQPGIRPDFFRLPKPGSSDPFFGFSRSFYYVGESRNYWKLVRICDQGKTKGVTLVRYSDIAAFVQRQIEAAK